MALFAVTCVVSKDAMGILVCVYYWDFKQKNKFNLHNYVLSLSSYLSCKFLFTNFIFKASFIEGSWILRIYNDLRIATHRNDLYVNSYKSVLLNSFPWY